VCICLQLSFRCRSLSGWLAGWLAGKRTQSNAHLQTRLSPSLYVSLSLSSPNCVLWPQLVCALSSAVAPSTQLQFENDCQAQRVSRPKAASTNAAEPTLGARAGKKGIQGEADECLHPRLHSRSKQPAPLGRAVWPPRWRSGIQCEPSIHMLPSAFTHAKGLSEAVARRLVAEGVMQNICCRQKNWRRCRHSLRLRAALSLSLARPRCGRVGRSEGRASFASNSARLGHRQGAAAGSAGANSFQSSGAACRWRTYNPLNVFQLAAMSLSHASAKPFAAIQAPPDGERLLAQVQPPIKASQAARLPPLKRHRSLSLSLWLILCNLLVGTGAIAKLTRLCRSKVAELDHLWRALSQPYPS